MLQGQQKFISFSESTRTTKSTGQEEIRRKEKTTHPNRILLISMKRDRDYGRPSQRRPRTKAFVHQVAQQSVRMLNMWEWQRIMRHPLQDC